MVSEPQLIPQLAKEYANEGFNVHVIDSWEALKELAATRPHGLYLIAYTRLRMHPKYRLCIKSRKTIVKKDGHSSVEYTEVCPSCRSPLSEKIRKGDKPKCSYCGEPLFTYIPENDRPVMTYRRWISEIEKQRHRHGSPDAQQAASVHPALEADTVRPCHLRRSPQRGQPDE